MAPSRIPVARERRYRLMILTRHGTIDERYRTFTLPLTYLFLMYKRTKAASRGRCWIELSTAPAYGTRIYRSTRS